MQMLSALFNGQGKNVTEGIPCMQSSYITSETSESSETSETSKSSETRVTLLSSGELRLLLED